MNHDDSLQISSEKVFTADPTVKCIAIELYETVANLPIIISPHGHVDPEFFGNPDAIFASTVDLFIIPDHYVTRMLYSQGIPLEELGVPRRDDELVETARLQSTTGFNNDPRAFCSIPARPDIWRRVQSTG